MVTQCKHFEELYTNVTTCPVSKQLKALDLGLSRPLDHTL